MKKILFSMFLISCFFVLACEYDDYGEWDNMSTYGKLRLATQLECQQFTPYCTGNILSRCNDTGITPVYEDIDCTTLTPPQVCALVGGRGACQ